MEIQRFHLLAKTECMSREQCEIRKWKYRWRNTVIQASACDMSAVWYSNDAERLRNSERFYPTYLHLITLISSTSTVHFLNVESTIVVLYLKKRFYSKVFFKIKQTTAKKFCFSLHSNASNFNLKMWQQRISVFAAKNQLYKMLWKAVLGMKMVFAKWFHHILLKLWKSTSHFVIGSIIHSIE